MAHEHANHDAPTRWIGPYRSVGEEPVPPPVREALRRRLGRGRLMLASGVLLAVAPCPVCGWVLVAFDQGTSRPGASSSLFVATILTVITLFVPAMLLLRFGTRSVRETRPNLHCETIEKFVLDERAAEELRAHAALGREVPTPPATIRVLTRRPLVAMTDDTVAGFEPVSVSLLAEPARASPARERTRSLTELELAELRGVVGRMGSVWRFVPSLILLHLTAGGIVYLAGGWMNWALMLAWAAAVFLLIRNVIGLFRHHVLRSQLRRDLQGGVARAAMNVELRERIKDQREAAGAVIPEYIEELPESGALWVVDGMPARWRQDARGLRIGRERS